MLVLAGCGQGPLPVEADDDDTGTDPDADADLPCEAVLVSITPPSGAVDVPLTGVVRATFSPALAPTDSWSLAVLGVSGGAVLAEDGLNATFTPDAPLSADTGYAVQSEVCGTEALSPFHTVAAVDPTTLEGRSYALSFGTVSFVTPSLANTLDPADWILFQLFDVVPAAPSVSTVSGLGNGSFPEPDCLNTFQTGSADLIASPAFTIGPADFQLPWDSDLVTIEDFQVAANFGPNGGTLVELVLEGALDTRGITTISNACQLSALTGLPCEPCRDGANRCLPVFATAPQADYYAGLDLVTTCAL